MRLVVRHGKLPVTACAYLAEVEARVTVALQARSWDCVVVGGGIREPEEQLELLSGHSLFWKC